MVSDLDQVFHWADLLQQWRKQENNNQNLVATEVRRTISPYDLTAADNSGAVISHPILKSNNYVEWACGFRTVLHSRKKFGFLDGTIPQPAATSPDLEDWWTINALIFSWMKMTIHPDFLTNISHRDVAIELWEHIRKRFSVSNGPRNQKMKADLATCKQSGTSVETYYGKLNKIWDNINNYRPLRTCTCGRCTCNLEEQQKKERMIWFISFCMVLMINISIYDLIKSDFSCTFAKPRGGLQYCETRGRCL